MSKTLEERLNVLSRDIEDIFKASNQTSREENYNIVWDEKNTLSEIDGRLDNAEENIIELEVTVVEIIYNKTQGEIIINSMKDQWAVDEPQAA